MTAITIVPLRATEITKSYSVRGHRLDVLKRASLELERGSVTALVGRSGSGKTTLLQIAGLLARPDHGTVVIDDVDASTQSESTRTRLRRSTLGFVFQAFNLLPQHNALVNVALPYFGGRRAAKRRALDLLTQVGLQDRAEHRPSELSAGEQQRVAVARALINDPAVLLADEPTGNLDAASEQMMLHLFRRVADEGRAVLLVTHSEAVCKAADKIVRIVEGTTTAAEQPTVGQDDVAGESTS